MCIKSRFRVTSDLYVGRVTQIVSVLAYMADITGGAETEWHFRPSWDGRWILLQYNMTQSEAFVTVNMLT